MKRRDLMAGVKWRSRAGEVLNAWAEIIKCEVLLILSDFFRQLPVRDNCVVSGNCTNRNHRASGQPCTSVNASFCLSMLSVG